ncbi:hypothetical protein [Candidatus Scalindua japonica]|uniref:hypothetical protein n=1 Tax=Candidatus Scalindua japonica TaxID=1284222 RepID=UPI0013A55DA7|nr:hypothetical protein [Candidatus Scalindua japonica]
MKISPDSIIFLQHEQIKLNATIVFTWAIIALLTIGSWVVTRSLSTGTRLSR